MELRQRPQSRREWKTVGRSSLILRTVRDIFPKMRRRYLQIVAVLTLVATGPPSHSDSDIPRYILKPAHGSPSFSCFSGGLSALERAICADETLSDLDSKLGSLYAAAKVQTGLAEAASLRQSQRDWIDQRNRCIHYA
jgi:hypothetical protein